MVSPVTNGRSSAWVPSKSYSAVAVPSPLGDREGLDAAGARGAAAIGEGAAAAAGASAEKRAANCGREAKYSSRREKNASFSALSCSMAEKTEAVAAAAPTAAPAAAAGAAGVGLEAEAEEAPDLIGGGGGRDELVDGLLKEGGGGGAEPVGLLADWLPLRPTAPSGTARSILSNMGVIWLRPFSA